MKLSVSILVSLLLNVGLTFVGQGHFLVDVLILSACIWIAVPLFLFSSIFLVVSYRKAHPTMISFGQWIMLGSLVVGSTFASLNFGGILNSKGIETAKAYCEQLAVTLDAAKAQTGSYPTNLAAIVEPSQLPRVLKNGNLYYHAQDTNFSITFSDPGGLMNGWDFNGNTKRWSRWD